MKNKKEYLKYLTGGLSAKNADSSKKQIEQMQIFWLAKAHKVKTFWNLNQSSVSHKW